MSFDRASGEICRNNLSHFHIDIGMASKQVSKIGGDIAGCQDPGGNLVKQRLELLIVVLVQKRDAHLAGPSQLACAI